MPSRRRAFVENQTSRNPKLRVQGVLDLGFSGAQGRSAATGLQGGQISPDN